MIHHLMTCWWSGQRLERYLDRDEAARLSDAEIARLEHHLSVCSKCATSAEDLVRLKATLARLPERSSVTPPRSHAWGRWQPGCAPVGSGERARTLALRPADPARRPGLGPARGRRRHGGLVAAHTAAGFGASVLLVERDRTGGDCLWTGCVPSKSLLAAAHAAADARSAAALGVHIGEVGSTSPR